ncbi:EAL domain-containing protein [Roseibium salinum]|uniref:EAL domain-containing protein n=1 Tax=Roseibium salinum TaxID=1604349 RepID=UPI003617B9EC
MRLNSIPFSRLILVLFTLGLVGTAVALFWITYLGSVSIAEHEIARTARSKATLARLVFMQHLDQLEVQIREVAADPAIRTALADNDKAAARKAIERATQGMTSATLDILLIDRPGEDGWVNTSLGLIDLSHQLPPDVRAAMPPDIWITYSEHDSEPLMVTTALAILVLDPETGQVLGRIFGGTTVTDSFTLPGELAKALQLDELAFYHHGHVVAGMGDLTREVLPETLMASDEDVAYHLKGDSLYVHIPLMMDVDGHHLSAVTKQPVDTLQKVEDTYSRLFTPFLIYTGILAIGAALIVNRITTTGLARLLTYAMSLRQDRVVNVPAPGFIVEFNQLATMFQAAFESIRNREAQFKEMIDGSLHGVLVHADNRILYVNEALLKILGYDPGAPEQLVGAPVLEIYASDEHSRLRSYYDMGKNGGAPRAYEIKGLTRTSEPIWLEQHVRVTEWRGVPAYYATITDISERKRQEELATKNANFDILTGLPNRRLLMDRLTQTIQRNNHIGEMTALMVLDLDRFKTVNETYGPKAGDQVIETMAARLTQVLGPEQTVARMGGDEFAIILSNPEDRWQIEQVARDILSEVERPVELEGNARIVLAGSLGITLSPNDGDDDEALLLQANTSMYQAKAESGSSYRFYATRMNEQTARSGQIEAALREAVERGGLHLNFQPIIDYPQGRIVSCEALARWIDPKLGSVPPCEFIKVAEESGLIVPLGEWVLREACRFYLSCNRNGLQLDSLSVNISPRQCRDAGFVGRLEEILTETGMEPARLHLEITESVMFDDQRADPIKILEAISALGVKISLDDFGTGYSSLSYLKRLPIDTLKIDRSFIMELERDADGQALVEAIVSMARSLEISVICEGAETAEQCDLISSFGCALIQGYSIARPMAGVDFHRYLARMNGLKHVMGRAG